MAGFRRVKVPVDDQRVGELGPLLVGAGAPVDAVRLGHRRDLVDEVEDALVGRGGLLVGGCLRVGGHALVFPLAHTRRSPVAGRPAGRRLRPPSVSAVLSWSSSGSRGVVVATWSSGETLNGKATTPRCGERIRAHLRLLLDRSRGPGCGFQQARPPRLSSSGCSAEQPAPVAQRIEHLTTDQKVGSSNLSGRADPDGPSASMRMRAFLVGDRRAASDKSLALCTRSS